MPGLYGGWRGTSRFNKDRQFFGRLFVCERPLLLLLFRHNAKSLNVQEERLAISPQLVTRLHLPHAIVVKLHLRKSNVVILTGNDGHNWCLSSSLSLSVGFSVQDEAMDGARSTPQRAHYHADLIYLLP